MASIRKRGDSYLVVVSAGYDIHGKKISYSETFVPDPKRLRHRIKRI